MNSRYETVIDLLGCVSLVEREVPTKWKTKQIFKTFICVRRIECGTHSLAQSKNTATVPSIEFDSQFQDPVIPII